MYRRIIIGHDLHDGGSDALALGRLIAEASGAKLVVAGVFPMGILPHGFAQQWREQEEGIAAEIQAIADEAGAEPEAFPSSSPGRGLHDLAEESGADLVVIGSSRHSKVGEIVAGNVGLGLLHGAPCAVAIAPRGYRDRAPGTLGPITVGFDGSEESGLALQDAIELAGASGVEIKLVAVAQLPPIVYGKGGGSGGGYQELEQAIEEHLRTELDEAAGAIPDGVQSEAKLVSGEPAAELAKAAGEKGLLILGSRAYGPVRRVLLGSVSTELMRSAPCPVIVHPRGTKVELATAQPGEAGSSA
jgi:nucleotide-binding universal stress UspA family protein